VRSARIAAQSLTAGSFQNALFGLGLAAALLTGLLTSSPAPAASGQSAGSVIASDAPVARAWDVLPELPQRLTAWLYETQRRASLSSLPSAAAR
jgi:hypothetical protein